MSTSGSASAASSIDSAVGVGITSTPCGRLDGDVRGEEDDVGAAPARLVGERHAHPPRRAVAEEAHRVERLARAARGDEHAAPCERARREQLLDPGGDLLRLRQPSDPPLAFRHLALVRADELDVPPHERRDVRPRRRAAHMRGFIAGATRTGPRCASAASVRTLSAMPWASFASVFAVHGATTSRSARVRCG